MLKPEQFLLISAIKHFCGANYRWSSDGRKKQHYNLWIVLDGDGTLITRGREYRLTAGESFFLRMWEPQRAWHGKRPLIVTSLHFRLLDENGAVIPPQQLHERDSLFPVHLTADDVLFFEKLTDRVVNRFQDGEPAKAHEWFAMVFRELERFEKLPDLSGPALEQYHRVQELCQQIDRHPGRSYRVHNLAREACCTPTHLNRLFRQFLGMGPQEYIIQNRVRHARGLLRNSGYSVSEIAELLNYSSPYHFSRQFKEKTGMSPTDYRKA